MPLVGDPIRLVVQLATGQANKFVRAYLFDAAGNPLLGTPMVNLTSLQRGMYFDNSVIFPPFIPQVKVIYVVYNDSGYTQVSRQNGNAADVFDVDTTNNQQITVINQQTLVGKIGDNGILTGCVVEEETIPQGQVINSQQLIGTLIDEEEIKGEIQEQEIVGQAVTDQTIKGEVEE